MRKFILNWQEATQKYTVREASQEEKERIKQALNVLDALKKNFIAIKGNNGPKDELINLFEENEKLSKEVRSLSAGIITLDWESYTI